MGDFSRIKRALGKRHRPHLQQCDEHDHLHSGKISRMILFNSDLSECGEVAENYELVHETNRDRLHKTQKMFGFPFQWEGGTGSARAVWHVMATPLKQTFIQQLASNFVMPANAMLIDRQEYLELVERVRAVEARTGIATADSPPQKHIELSADTMASIAAMTEELFGVPAVFQEKAGDVGEDDYVLVKVQVAESADPREIATKRSAWHYKLNDLDVREKQHLRLKVVYK